MIEIVFSVYVKLLLLVYLQRRFIYCRPFSYQMPRLIGSGLGSTCYVTLPTRTVQTAKYPLGVLYQSTVTHPQIVRITIIIMYGELMIQCVH